MIELDQTYGTGYRPWWQQWNAYPAQSTQEIVRKMRNFVVGDRPSPGQDDQMRYWQSKARCEVPIKTLRESSEKSSVLYQEYEQTQRLLKDAKDYLEKLEKDLEDNTKLEPILRREKEKQEKIWLPVENECKEKYTELKEKRDTHMREETPKYYDDSCEKDCIEKQKEFSLGCGLMEGATPTDPTSRGGVMNGCLPPYPSWIKRPFTYGAEEESAFNQCDRIFSSSQKPRHAQRILMRGTMRKQGRWWKWDSRFFILESGDSMRSAVLRYWEKDPGSNRNVEERVDKKIIMWDAKSVRSKGSYCFKIYHFYRTYYLCAGDKSGSTRNKWVRHLKASIRFR